VLQRPAQTTLAIDLPHAPLARSFYYKRGQYPLKKISEWAAKRGFTHLLVLSERLKTPNGCVLGGVSHRAPDASSTVSHRRG
jgi:rRNA maturation protein Rpf1